eukprot:759209-Hanusia_phi.AAC.11
MGEEKTVFYSGRSRDVTPSTHPNLGPPIRPHPLSSHPTHRLHPHPTQPWVIAAYPATGVKSVYPTQGGPAPGRGRDDHILLYALHYQQWICAGKAGYASPPLPPPHPPQPPPPSTTTTSSSSSSSLHHLLLLTPPPHTPPPRTPPSPPPHTLLLLLLIRHLDLDLHYLFLCHCNRRCRLISWQAGGNFASALLLTVMGNMLVRVFVPLITGKLLQELPTSDHLVRYLFLRCSSNNPEQVRRTVATYNKHITYASNALLVLIPWMKISKSVIEGDFQKTRSSAPISHCLLQMLNYGLSVLCKLEVPFQKAVVLVGSSKTLPMALTVRTWRMS